MSHSHSPQSKKRKRAASPEDSGLAISLADANQKGPVLASFSAVKPPDHVPFRVYSRKKKKLQISEEPDSEPSCPSLLVAETEVAEFVTNPEETSRASSSGCYYLLAVRKPSSSTLTVLPTPLHPHVISPPTIKALKRGHNPQEAAFQDFYQARTALGETFGSKKAQAAIRQRERNKVDTAAMEGVVEHLMDGIDQAAEGLLSKDEVQETADAARPVPPHNVEATRPEDVYPLYNVIPSAEWKAIKTVPYFQTESYQERLALLPHQSSNWVRMHLRMLDKQGDQKKQRDTLKMLIYVSTMMAFNHKTSFHSQKYTREEIQKKFPTTSLIILDGLMSRFMEQGRAPSTTFQRTTSTDTLLQTYMFALCLRVDRWSTDTSYLAHDLSLPLAKVNDLFKTLGCTMRLPSERDKTKMDLSTKDAANKRAVLVIPVQFPKPRTGKKGKRK
ncbi:RNA polymerase I associated factor, A49-like protein [Flagelloscypha sp. PMI_526]|nr:RNA polymerase I associated factor, A49-like protein [Flagelloscypha sp. PMI_526]